MAILGEEPNNSL